MREVITVKEITEVYLKANGFDGLYGEYCSCFVDDLMPCLGFTDREQGVCEAGHKIPCPDPAECDCGGEPHIGEKP